MGKTPLPWQLEAQPTESQGGNSFESNERHETFFHWQAAEKAANENLIVFAETGSGKTMVAELAIKARTSSVCNGQSIESKFHMRTSQIA